MYSSRCSLFNNVTEKKIKNITVWRGSKNDIQKWSSQWKIFHIPKLKEKNKFLGYLAILKLSRKDIIYKNGREGTSCGTKWLLSGSLQLPVIGMGLFERRQHYNNSCTINCQETFMILDFEVRWQGNNRCAFSCHIFLFIAFP